MNLNKIFVLGRVTSDIDLKALPSGQSVINFSIATNRYWQDKEGNKQEDVQFHNCVAFGKSAETIEKYVGKGDLLFVIGRVSTRSWEDKNSGEKKYRTEVHIEEFQLAPKSAKASGSEDRRSPAETAFDSLPDNKTSKKADSEEGINPEDIPF